MGARMKTKIENIQWKSITPEGHEMIKAMVAEQYNEVAMNYGAMPMDVPNSPISPKPETRYKLRSATSLLSSKPIKWRIKGVIPDSGIAAIYGHSGSAKSFLAIDMAMNVASGSDWFGYRVKACPVVYVCLEGEAGLSVRIGAWKEKGKIPSRIKFIDQPLNLLNVKDVRDLVTAIKTHEVSGGLVIIDTLNRAAPGMDENSSVDMGNAINAAKLIQQGVGGLVLLVHHSGKDSSKGMRGHSSLHAALDAAIEVKRSGDDREWSVAKAKDGEDGRSHTFRLQVVDMGVDEDGDSITSCVIQEMASERSKPKQLTPSQRLGMESFMEAASENISSDDKSVHAHLEQWRAEYYKRSTADNQDSKRKAFSRVRNELVEGGKLLVNGEVYRLPDSFPDFTK
jgi:hypothetical protein